MWKGIHWIDSNTKSQTTSQTVFFCSYNLFVLICVRTVLLKLEIQGYGSNGEFLVDGDNTGLRGPLNSGSLRLLCIFGQNNEGPPRPLLRDPGVPRGLPEDSRASPSSPRQGVETEPFFEIRSVPFRNSSVPFRPEFRN